MEHLLLSHLKDMTLRRILFLLLMLICFKGSSFAQIQKSELQLTEYLAHLKSLKVDTVLIVKSGCTGCEISYTDTANTVSNGETIFVLSQQSDRYKLVSFDDFSRQKSYSLDKCTLFDTIQHYKTILTQKESFYKNELAELKEVKFFPPRPIHYSYEKIAIQLPSFTYDFMLVDEEFDYLGFSRDNENWFKVTQNLFKQFLALDKRLLID